MFKRVLPSPDVRPRLGPFRWRTYYTPRCHRGLLDRARGAMRDCDVFAGVLDPVEGYDGPDDGISAHLYATTSRPRASTSGDCCWRAASASRRGCRSTITRWSSSARGCRRASSSRASSGRNVYSGSRWRACCPTSSIIARTSSATRCRSRTGCAVAACSARACKRGSATPAHRCGSSCGPTQSIACMPSTRAVGTITPIGSGPHSCSMTGCAGGCAG